MHRKPVLIPKRSNGFLHGVHCIREENPRDPLIIMCHGMMGDKTEMGRYPYAAEQFNKAGYDAIYFDYSGSGENEREQVLLSQQIKDTEDVFKWAQSSGYKTIGTLGLSFGGLTVLLAQLPERKAAVFWAPAFYMSRIITKFVMKFMRVFHHINNKISLKSSGVGIKPIFVTYDFIKEIEAIEPVHKQLSEFAIPTLIIQGQTDTAVRVNNTREAFSYMMKDDRHKMVEFPNCGHLFENDNTAKATQLTIEWFDKYLK